MDSGTVAKDIHKRVTISVMQWCSDGYGYGFVS